MGIKRYKTKVVKIGNISIGGNNPVAIQSMAKTKTSDIEKTVRQIKELEKAGCEIVRLAIKDNADACGLKKIKAQVSIPIVADIHFNWRLALAAIDNGADKIRLNPGNIYKKEQIKEVVQAAKFHHIPIRVGLNSGSLPQTANRKAPACRQAGQTEYIAERMVKSALDYIKILEKFGFSDIVISLKASSILDTILAYRKIAKVSDYPLHLGVTATGLPGQGAVKSSIAIGALLLEGIGDTIRVSLTAKPQEEVKAARFILEALGLRHFGPEIISCPTCGRCEVDLVNIVKELEDRLSAKRSTLNAKIAVMGCVVNGPGEAKEADFGVAFGKQEGLLFRKGKPIKKVSFHNCADALLKEMSN